MSGRTVRAMVTGVGGGGHGEQILKALRLAETGYHVLGSDMSPFSSGLAEVDEACLTPPATDPDFIDTLIGACRAREIEVLFHGSEPELKAISEARDRIADAGIFLPINPTEVIDLCLDKLATMRKLSDLGFAVPEFSSVSSTEEAEVFEHLPAVLKPSVGGGGSANLYLVQNREEMVACAAQFLAVHPEFIAQEYVGTPEDEYTVGVLTDMDGELINSIAIHRQIMSALSNRIKAPNRSGREALGPTLAVSSGVSQGAVVDAAEVRRTCEEIAAAIGSRGPLNVQCRFVDGELLPFEINPRFSGTTSMRAMVGFNEPDLLVRHHVLGEDIERGFPYTHATIMRSLSETVIEAPSFPLASEL